MSSTIEQPLFPSYPSPSSSLPSTLWLPPDAFTQPWADFGAEALAPAALIATGQAFLALSWEASALRHYAWAQQEQCYGTLRLAPRYLKDTFRALSEALGHWRRAALWLERLRQNEGPHSSSYLHAIQTLFGEAIKQQQRLSTLLEQVRQEQNACQEHPFPAEAASVQGGKEEEVML